MKKVGIGCFGLFLFAVGLAVIGSFMKPSVPGANTTGGPAMSSGLTLNKFLEIETGMTYKQVVGIIGEPGEESSRLELAGTTTVMYTWKLWYGANMNAMFQNGKLISKAQFGLR